MAQDQLGSIHLTLIIDLFDNPPYKYPAGVDSGVISSLDPGAVPGDSTKNASAWTTWLQTCQVVSRIS